jgi:hypothetical protein
MSFVATDPEPPDPPSALPPAAVPDDPLYEAKTLRAFIRGDRLVRIPARERKRGVILRFLLERVFPDLEPIHERDVNMRLALWNPDVSSLRRFLVDGRLVSRAGMVYRRVVPLPASDDRTAGDRPSGPPFV